MKIRKLAIGAMSGLLTIGTLGASVADDKAKPAVKQESKEVKVPDGTPKELMAFIQKQMRSSRSPTAQTVRLCIEAADKMAAHKDATKQEQDNGRQVKLQLLYAGASNVDKAVFTPELLKYAEELAKSSPGSDIAATADGYKILLNHFKNGEWADAAGAELLAFARSYPKSMMGIQLNSMYGNQMADKDSKKATEHLNEAVKLYAGNPAVKSLEGTLKGLKLIGSTMELVGPTLAGTNLNIEDMKGKVIVVDFWATWCGPCVAALPNLQKVYDKHHAKGLEVIAVSLDQDRKKLDDYVKTHKLPWPQVIFEGKDKMGWANPIAQQYGINGIPAMYLVGKDGKVIQKLNAHDEAGLEKAVTEAMKQTPSPRG